MYDANNAIFSEVGLLPPVAQAPGKAFHFPEIRSSRSYIDANPPAPDRLLPKRPEHFITNGLTPGRKKTGVTSWIFSYVGFHFPSLSQFSYFHSFP